MVEFLPGQAFVDREGDIRPTADLLPEHFKDSAGTEDQADARGRDGNEDPRLEAFRLARQAMIDWREQNGMSTEALRRKPLGPDRPNR